jgi:hypothetical protein
MAKTFLDLFKNINLNLEIWRVQHALSRKTQHDQNSLKDYNKGKKSQNQPEEKRSVICRGTKLKIINDLS